MKQILWFRRDLRIDDSALLFFAKDEVLPIFIFDKHILSSLPSDDKRVTFIYDAVLKLKDKLKSIGLDLAVFHEEPALVFERLKKDFCEILCSVDFDEYARKRDEKISHILPLKRYNDNFILNPNDHLKKDGTPYRVFTPFYNSLHVLTSSNGIGQFKRNPNLKLAKFDFSKIPTLKDLGFTRQKLPDFCYKSGENLLEDFTCKINDYKKKRDYFYENGTSNISVHLRFGLISAKQVFNRSINEPNSKTFIKELFWREFYNYILFHNPKSEFENFNSMQIKWNENEEDFLKWCKGETGVPIIDASMKHLNETGTMHNRLRMVVSSFLTKNLFIDWKKGERYFASKLLDFETSSNVGSWQWAASTGADSVPYFRVFNPYTQSKKFDKDGVFIKSVLKELKDVPAKLFHIENGVHQNLFVSYPKSMVDISFSRKMAIEKFKKS